MLFGRLRGIVQTLRFRLAAWVALVVSLVVCVTMLSIREVVLRTIHTEFDQRLQKDMVDVCLLIKDYLPNREAAFDNLINRKGLGHLHVDWFVELFDIRGNLIWATSNAPKLKPPGASFEEKMLRNEAAVRFLETRTEDADGRPMIVRLGSTLLSMDDDIALLNLIVVLSSVSILALAPLSAYFLAGRATRPLNWIISTTARLEPKKLDERLPIRGTGDELDQLSATINGMLDRIAIYLPPFSPTWRRSALASPASSIACCSWPREMPAAWRPRTTVPGSTRWSASRSRCSRQSPSPRE
jgi:HAMP domain-containing protein